MSKSAILEFLRLYYYRVLFPLALVLLLVGSYGMIMNPGLFIAKKSNCYGGDMFECQEFTVEKTGLEFFGLRIGPERIVPTLSEDEFLEKKARIDSINFWINVSLLLVSAGLIMKGIGYYNENKKKESQEAEV